MLCKNVTVISIKAKIKFNVNHFVPSKLIKQLIRP